ncbi:hypothetical protein T484DRAFT_1903995 [Baffinella frigidus]|nr:hypothetical protein T484DRAFT_1903995 [Cryptophyta sp. CCMP2293]
MVKHKARRQRQGYHNLVLDLEVQLQKKQETKRNAVRERVEREKMEAAGQGGKVGALNGVTLKDGEKFSFNMGGASARQMMDAPEPEDMEDVVETNDNRTPKQKARKVCEVVARRHFLIKKKSKKLNKIAKRKDAVVSISKAQRLLDADL